MSPHRIAKLLRRSPNTIRSHVIVKKKPTAAKPVGRPPMSEQDYKKCFRALVRLQKKAKAREEVTAAMVKAEAGVGYCEKVIRKAFNTHGYPFRKFREKPKLKKSDVKKRHAFGKKHYKKPAEPWISDVHGHVDNKRFPMYLDQQAREHAARRSVRGAYRSGKDAVADHLVKQKESLKFPVPGVQVTAGVVHGRIRFWKVVQGRWNAKKAVEMYGDLAKCMAKAYPTHAAKPNAKWVVLEDNDPSGYKSSDAVSKKREEGIKVRELPPRSPDLNVLDYSLWKAITKRLRKQEATFHHRRKESKSEYLARLRKTALGLPSAVVRKAVYSMKRRCKEVKENGGYLIKGD